MSTDAGRTAPGRLDRDALTILSLLMVRQASGIADCARNLVAAKGADEGYRAFISTELSDTLVLVQRFCEELGLNFNELILMGWERHDEKRTSWQRRHPDRKWV